MDSSKPDSCFLRSTSAVSLNERHQSFISELLVSTQTLEAVVLKVCSIIFILNVDATEETRLSGSSFSFLLGCFSQVLDQLTRSRTVTFDPLQLQQRRASAPPPVVLLVKREPPSSLALQVKQRLARRSVWTRLGWRRATRRLAASGARRGFWSFRNKYRWRAALSSAHRSESDLTDSDPPGDGVDEVTCGGDWVNAAGRRDETSRRRLQ
eukprot:superscaffoldBa00010534_g24761